MSRYNKPIDYSWRSILAQSMAVLILVFIMIMFLPSDRHTFLHVDVGRPWPYSQFIAPYDFPIFKSEAQLKQEQDSIRRLYEPYFELRMETYALQVNRFREDAQKLGGGGLSPVYQEYIEEHLAEVYHRGILATEDWQRLKADSCTFVRLYTGTEAVARSAASLLTPKTAYEALLADADSAGVNRQQLQRLNLNKYVVSNLEYDKTKSDDHWKGLLNSLSPSTGMVLAGQSIIDRGEIVTEETHQILQSYERATEALDSDREGQHLTLLGQILYLTMIFACLVVYFNLFRKDYITNLRSISLVVILLLLFPLISYFLVSHTILSVYIVPYAMLPIFVRVFMDSRTAFITHAAMIMLCAIALRYPYEFIATQCVAGLVAVFTLRELSQRSQLFRTAFFVTLSALIFFLSLDLIHGHTLVGGDSLTRIDWNIYKHIIVSGILLLFAYPLMYFFERLFGFASNVTLVELSNVNNELLQRLSEVAPGTFQHSIQVANLSAEVARKIGAKSQLVRTGALYHDIGKMQNAAFFTENQMGSNNPHDKLSNVESARIIIDHVRQGEILADNYRLPRVIRDFISTHHGHGLVKFFYISEKKKYPQQEIDPEPFTYPGQNPQTAEQAILLMTDAVEASARSLKEYTEESISQLVDRIVDGQLADGLFTECPLTFQDIRTAKMVFKDKLKTIYHTRISYPTLKD